MTPDERQEWLTCSHSPLHFAARHCRIFDPQAKTWIEFGLWPAQAKTLKTIQRERFVVILKARQLGMTWLCLAYALWQMLFNPSAAVLLFSRRDDEAMELLSDEKLKGMYARLPEWMQARSVVKANEHEWILSNGSRALAFPSNAGDSYTGSLVIIDEADLVPDLGRLLRSVKPTIDAGGQLILLSRADKDKPQSEFKRIYRAAKKKENGWAPIFLPWHVRPSRNAAWYEEQRRDIESRTGSLDDLHEQYPETDTQALAPRSLDKRIPSIWLEACYAEETGSLPAKAPAIPGLVIYRAPRPGRRYALGVDPAEGNPTSDPSALTVLDAVSGEECAVLSGQFQPAMMAAYADKVGCYYNNAGVMVERNNHGHAVILWLRDHSALTLLTGHDGNTGWLSSPLGKVILYDKLTEYYRAGAQGRTKMLHSFATYTQLASIEGNTLRAPAGEHDDLADSYALAHAGALVVPPVAAVITSQAVTRADMIQMFG